MRDDGLLLAADAEDGTLVDAPIPGRTGHTTVWADDRVVVWGGMTTTGVRDDGAAYRPDVDEWTLLPGAPLSPRTDAAATWTGQEFVVLGGRDLAGPLGDGAAYDPDRDTWRTLPDLPDPVLGPPAGSVDALWTGRTVVAWVVMGSDDDVLHTLEPGAEAWTDLAGPPRDPSVHRTVRSTHDHLVVVDESPQADAPQVHVIAGSWAGSWAEIDLAHVDVAPWNTAGLVAVRGTDLVLLGSAQGLILDLENGDAEVLPTPADWPLARGWAPLGFTVLRSTGNTILLWDTQEASGPGSLPTVAYEWLPEG